MFSYVYVDVLAIKAFQVVQMAQNITMNHRIIYKSPKNSIGLVAYTASDRIPIKAAEEKPFTRT